VGRPRRDGSPARAVNKRKLSDRFVNDRRPPKRPELVWDAKQPNLALSVRPTGKRAWKVVYRFHGKLVWYHVGDAKVMGLAAAREEAQEIMLAVTKGKDPAAARRAERSSGTFAELAAQYVELYSRKHNKSWKQSERLVAKHLLPKFGMLKAHEITRTDVRLMMASIDAPILANQVLKSASAIFSWAIKQEMVTANPCKLVDKNPATSRERVLSDAEVARMWPHFDTGLRLILLTGQRPGEVTAMQRPHIVDGWWQMPGKPQGDWPGTKNARDHRVWLSDPAQALIDQHLSERPSAKVSATRMSKLVSEMEIERATPHDLRRTCLTIITRLGFGRDAMDRVANHKSNKVTDVYDRHGYADEDKMIMAAVARLISDLVDVPAKSNVVSLR